MEIGVDATCWWNRRGFGRFTRELLKAMLAAPRGHRFCLFTDRPPEPEMAGPHVRVVQVPVTRPVTAAAVADGRRSLGDVWRFGRAAAAEPLDVMFFPAVYSWFPVPRRTPSAVTLHDAIAEHYPELIFPDRKGRFFWSLKMRLARHWARRVLTVSDAAREEIVAYAGVRRDIIDVICEGADPRFRPVADPARRAAVRAAAGLPPRPARLILYVGAVAPHKNLPNFVRGFAEALREPGLEDLHLAISGDPGGDGFHSSHAALVRQVEAEPVLRGRVHFTGFVSDEDLPTLYSDALATTLPSLSEGFGLPVLESMACGTPVLVSRTGAAPEVAGAGGLAFDPLDPASIARQIRIAATEPATWDGLRTAALARARHYTWERAAELALVSLEACAGRP